MRLIVLKPGKCIVFGFYCNFINRGDEFRVEFSKLGTLRSLLPNHVNVLALTATATKETLRCVEDRLAMKDVKVIGLHSSRPNIKYIVKSSILVEELATMLTTELVTLRTRTPKTVVFCRTLLQCANLLASLTRHLKENITEPPGMPATNINYRLIDIFTSGSTAEMRELIIQEFCKRETHLRMIIATSAFGLGVDCVDISRVIHWGPPSTLEELAQETGRAGRNGALSEAILFYKKSGKHISKSMKAYGENTKICRRKLLFQNFLFAGTNVETLTACHCCDLCTPLCNCISCNR